MSGIVRAALKAGMTTLNRGIGWNLRPGAYGASVSSRISGSGASGSGPRKVAIRRIRCRPPLSSSPTVTGASSRRTSRYRTAPNSGLGEQQQRAGGDAVRFGVDDEELERQHQRRPPRARPRPAARPRRASPAARCRSRGASGPGRRGRSSSPRSTAPPRPRSGPTVAARSSVATVSTVPSPCACGSAAAAGRSP